MPLCESVVEALEREFCDLHHQAGCVVVDCKFFNVYESVTFVSVEFLCYVLVIF